MTIGRLSTAVDTALSQQSLYAQGNLEHHESEASQYDEYQIDVTDTWRKQKTFKIN